MQKKLKRKIEQERQLQHRKEKQKKTLMQCYMVEYGMCMMYIRIGNKRQTIEQQ